MLILGYFVTKNKDKYFDEDIFKYVSSEEECVLKVPRIITGLKEAKAYAERNGFEFDILERQFPDGNWWTFKKTEKRDVYERDVMKFKEYIKQKVTDNVNYTYVNVLNLKFSDIKRLYGILIGNSMGRFENYIIIDGNMLYYPIKKGSVMGISLTMMEYVNINKNKVMGLIKSNPHNKIYYTSSRNMRDIKSQFSGNEYVIADIFQKFERKAK